MLYELNSGYKNEAMGVCHNHYGMRGKGFSVEKKKGVYRIVCMGESSTYCIGLKDDETYPSRLEFYLRECGLDIEVINAGVPGYTSAENLMYFVFKVQDLKPDLVMYYYTHNDVHPRRLPHLSRDYREYSKVWDFKQGFIRFLFSKISTIFTKKKGVEIAEVTRKYSEYPDRPARNVLKNPPSYFKDKMKSLALLVRGFGSQLLFINSLYPDLEFFEREGYHKEQDNPYNYGVKGVYEHRNVIYGLCQEMNIHYLDMYGLMPKYKRSEKYQGTQETENLNVYFLDSAHLKANGADLMARLLSDHMMKTNIIKRLL